MNEPLVVREAPASYQVAPESQGVRPSYKQTEVGVIPEDWEVAPLSLLIDSLDAGVSVNSVEKDKDIYAHDESILKTSCVLGGKFLPEEHKQILPHDIHRAKLNPRKGSIIFSRMNTPALVGECGYVDRDYPNLFIPDRLWMTRLEGTHSSCAKWLAYLLSFGSFNRAIKDTATGTSGSMKNISKGSLLSVHVPLPTKAEQEAIAEALSDADALIESLEQLIAKKRHLKQGAMQELLFPKDGWVEKRLGSTATLKARIGWQGLTTAEYLETGDYYLVTGTDFKGGYIDWSHCHYVERSRYKQDKNIQLRRHDVLVTKDGTIGKVALVNHLDKPATLNSGVFVIRPIDGAFHPDFFYYLLCSNVFSEFLTQLSAGSTINHLYQKDFVTFNYKTPITIEEQTAIATLLSDMDAEITALEAKLTKARQVKQGMMHNLLTGKVRLVKPSVVKDKQHVPMSGNSAARNTTEKAHNWQINEAVVISMLADRFGKPDFPLGRKRYTKLSYLLHRKAEREAQGYLKKAAGPYNPKTKYAGPEKIAQEKGYVRYHDTGKYKGFIAAENIEQAKAYFAKWYGAEIAAWLEQFRRSSNDELERLATVDMAMQELHRQGKTGDVAGVRALIASEPEWLQKLERTVFSDAGIAAAIAQSQTLFGSY